MGLTFVSIQTLSLRTSYSLALRRVSQCWSLISKLFLSLMPSLQRCLICSMFLMSSYSGSIPCLLQAQMLLGLLIMGLVLPCQSKFSKLIIIKQQMTSNSNNIVKKSHTCESKRNHAVSPIRPLQIVRMRKRSRSVSSISSKQSSMQGRLQKKINYKISREHVALLIEEERTRDRDAIEGSEALQQYYNCFVNLFKIIYLSAETVIKHSFYRGEDQLNFDKLQIVGSLIGEFEAGWGLAKTTKLAILAENVYQLSRNLADFSRRMQYVSRKICMNKSKRANIQNAFVNQNLMRHWQVITKNQQFMHANEFLLDMCEKEAERLCYLDVRRFVNRCLCKAEFRQQIVRYCKKEDIDQEMDLSYTFQFFLIEEFCLAEDLETGEAKSKLEKDQSKCYVM